MKAHIVAQIYPLTEREGKKSAKQLLNLGGYDFVTDEALRILALENCKRENEVDIVLVEFENYVDDYNVVLDEFKNLGLEIPQMQDLLHFGAKYRGYEEELGANNISEYLIIFPHYPYLNDKYHPQILHIQYDCGTKERGISVFWFGTQMFERRYFAARKPRQIS